ncbi:MAG: class I SAM-dependent methyltransferase [Hyphomicrobiales bacterium]|nr:class I SAM-dependent methyltransferase [Hyphomicrobiales bacterium]
MRIIIDEEAATVTQEDASGRVSYELASSEGFDLVSRAWLRASWDAKYPYAFTWFGRPVIQLPEDMVRLQEVLWHDPVDVLIETGVAHGGGLIFYASLFKAMERGRVIGVELALRPHNRAEIDRHLLAPLISLVDGSSVAPDTVAKVGSMIKPGEKVMVLLDSNHSRVHVLAELRAYAPFVQPGGFMVATDGIMQAVVGAPRTQVSVAPRAQLFRPRVFLCR